MATKQEMAVAKYATQLKKMKVPVDMKKLEKVTKELGSANYRLDAMFVAASDKKELMTVYKNFVVKKLGVKNEPKGMKVVMDVAKKMKKIRKKYRGVFYYMVSKNLGK